MNYFLLSKTSLFRGVSEKEAETMLNCLGASTKTFEKGEIIYRAGMTVESIGMVISGGAIVSIDDVWGNSGVFSIVDAGEIFAEMYACIPGEHMMVNVTASEKTEILFLNVSKLINVCSHACSHHSQLIQNLLRISAYKNLQMSKRMLHTSSKSIRRRLLSYLSEQATEKGSYRFTIPYNRQQLADYLSVDRSAMCSELSKMRKDGIISYDKNNFILAEDHIGGEK